MSKRYIVMNKGDIMYGVYGYAKLVDCRVINKVLCPWKWEFSKTEIGELTPTSSDKLKIANFIANLPSSDYLENRLTFDQVGEALGLRDRAVRVARCFVAGHDAPDNPMFREVEDGIISQIEADQIWLHSDLFENLWKLLTAKERKIKTVLERNYGFPFDNVRELLEEIIRHDFDWQFALTFRDAKITANQMHCYRKIAIKKNPSDKEREAQWKLRDKLGASPIWLERLVNVLEALSERDKLIATRFSIHQTLTSGLSKLPFQASCNPETRYLVSQTKQWSNGFRV